MQNPSDLSNQTPNTRFTLENQYVDANFMAQEQGWIWAHEFWQE